MKKIIQFCVLAFFAVMGGCSPDKLKAAVPDILTAVGATKSDVCEAYQEKGRGIVEAAWEHDWPIFAPIFERETPDPVLDEAFCRELIEDRGALIELKPWDSHASTALMYAVGLHPDFYRWSAKRRAQTICHEAGHVVSQHRVGPARSAKDYATISGRLASEAGPYALGDLMYRWYGVSEEKIVKVRRARAKKFPKMYKLTRTVSPECVLDHFTRVSDELARRAAVALGLPQWLLEASPGVD